MMRDQRSPRGVHTHIYTQNMHVNVLCVNKDTGQGTAAGRGVKNIKIM